MQIAVLYSWWSKPMWGQLWLWSWLWSYGSWISNYLCNQL